MSQSTKARYGPDQDVTFRQQHHPGQPGLFDFMDMNVAVFADVGQDWFRDEGTRGHPVLADVGFGLRLIPAKSDTGQVIHLDVAHPLNNDLPNADGIQVSIEMKKSL